MNRRSNGRTRSNPLTAGERTRLVAAAGRALRQAYAPYSHFHVGAAVLTASGKVYTGCNVENASYGLTNCAERSAIFTAVGKEGAKMRVRAVAVATGAGVDCAPCGACRQVIAEFGPDAAIIFKGKRGWRTLSASQLLPASFGKEDLHHG